MFIKDGQEFLPGIQAIAAPGHTVGHTIFMISSGGKQLCYIGDLTHHPVLLMEKPLTEFAYDTDPKQSAQTRVKMLNMLADEPHPDPRLSLRLAGHRPCGEAGRGFPVLSGADEHGAVRSSLSSLSFSPRSGEKVARAKRRRRMRGCVSLTPLPTLSPQGRLAGRGERQAIRGEGHRPNRGCMPLEGRADFSKGMFHSFSVRPELAEANGLPSRENATPNTVPLCPAS